MKTTAITILMVLLVANCVLADDVFPAPWRSTQTNTLAAHWDNWINYPNCIPDSYQYGPTGLSQPIAVAQNAGFLNEFAGRSNVIEILADDGLVFELDNYDQERPEKHVRIQITYYMPAGAPGTEPIGFDVTPFYGGTPGQDQFIPAVLEGQVGPDANGWITSAYDFTITPNPDEEHIGLKFSSYPVAYVDQVVIDTWCVPEPATLGLLLLGGLALLRRRRAN